MSVERPIFLFLVSLFSLAVIGANAAHAGPTATPTPTSTGAPTASPTPTPIDRTPPRIHGLVANPAELWPPNGRLVLVSVDVRVEDSRDPDPRCLIIDIEDSAPSHGREPDWELRSDLEVALRAKRGGSDGRTYTLIVECRDKSGNISPTGTTSVSVPHNAPGSSCACWSREELKSIAPNPDTATWTLTCKRGDDERPDADSIERSLGRQAHLANVVSENDAGEHFCQYITRIPNLPVVHRFVVIDEGAYEICRDQVRLRQKILGITDQCITN